MGASESVFAPTDALAESTSAGATKGHSPSGRGRDWVEALMPSLEGKSARRAALQKRFGTAVGQVRGLGQYLQTVEEQTTEVLADNEWGVPVEDQHASQRRAAIACDVRVRDRAEGVTRASPLARGAGHR